MSWRRIKTLLNGTVGGGFVIISTFSIVSRVLGLLRDRLLSSHFGVGPILDAYYAAFRLPDLIFNIFVLGALASVFLPVFLEVWNKDQKEAWRVTNSVLNILLLIVFVLVIVMEIFAKPIVQVLVSGFTPENIYLTASLTRIMLIGILFFTISNVAGAVLNSFRRFFFYALSPIAYNLGIILGIIFLAPIFGPKGLAFGVVLGSLMHLLVQLPAFLKTGWRWQLILDFKNQFVKTIGRLMLPRFFGLAIGQFNLVVATFIGSLWGIGAITIYNLAFNLISFPINIFGVSLALAVFPVFTSAMVNNSQKDFVYHFSKTVRRILFLTIPSIFFILLLRQEIVGLILGAGKFSSSDINSTALVLSAFALCLVSESLSSVLARAFYARKDTLTPVKAAIVGFCVNAVGCLILGRKFGALGMALSFSLSSICGFIVLTILLRLKTGPLDFRRIVLAFFRILGAALVMFLVMLGVKTLLSSYFIQSDFLFLLKRFIIISLTGLVVFLGLSRLFRFEEIDAVRNIFRLNKSERTNGK